jgi:hypothetical protein
MIIAGNLTLATPNGIAFDNLGDRSDQFGNALRQRLLSPEAARRWRRGTFPESSS